MLSPEEIKAARQQYGLDKPQGTTGASPFSSGQQKPDHGARMERLRKLTSSSVQEEGGEPGLLSKVGHGIAAIGKGIVKPIAQTAVQFPRAVAAGAAGLAGNEELEERFSKPVNVPLLGEVKGLSAVPGQSEEYGTQTPGQTLGQAAEIGANLIGAGAAKGVAKQAAKGAIKQAIGTGALEGAVTGGLSGLGTSLEDQESGRETGKNILKGIATGGLVGGAAGALGGALSKTGRESIKASRAASKLKKAEKDVLSIVSPELNKAEKATAIASGRGTESGLFKGSKLLPTDREKEMSQALIDVIKPKKDLVSNVNATREAIGKEADEVIESLKDAQVSYSPESFKSSLGEIEKPITLSGDDRLNKMYDLATDKFMKFIDKNDKDLSGLLKSRKEFDSWLEKQLPKVWEDTSVRPLHQALRDVRGAANEFIASRLPNGSPFLKSLRKQNLMYEAIDNMSDKAAKEFEGGTLIRKVKAFGKKHPIASTAITSAVGSGVAGSILKE